MAGANERIYPADKVTEAESERTDMKQGDWVFIIKSPYSSVKNGTVAKIGSIKENHFSKGHHLYILDDLRCKAFREHELRLVDDEVKNG